MALFDPPYVFLTTKPQNRFLSEDHPEYLSILPLQEPTDPVHLYINITYFDNADVEHKLIDDLELAEGVAQHINISYAERDYKSITSGKTIRSITFYTKSADTDFDFDTEPTNDNLTYYPFVPKKDTAEIKAFYYHNSYGGLDSIIALGDHQESIEYRHLQTRKSIVVVNQNQTDHNYMMERGIATRTFTFWTGPKTKKEIQALRCLPLINRGYEYKDVDGQASMVPIIIQGDFIEFPTEMANVWNLKFTYRYSFDDRAFDRVP